MKAKQDYEAAAKRDDKDAMDAAHKLAESARKNGGTISAETTLADAKKEKTSLASSITTSVLSMNTKTKTAAVLTASSVGTVYTSLGQKIKEISGTKVDMVANTNTPASGNTSTIAGQKIDLTSKATQVTPQTNKTNTNYTNTPVATVSDIKAAEANQRAYLTNLSKGSGGSASWAKQELAIMDKAHAEANQRTYLTNLSKGSGGSASWAKQELKKLDGEEGKAIPSGLSNPAASSTGQAVNRTQASSSTGSATIKRGQSGDGVKAVQEMLKEAGYEIEADGQFGAKTEATVKQFQKDHGLQADGMIGNQTINMLGAVSSTMDAPDYVKAAAINSAKKAEPGEIHSDTLIISDEALEAVIKQAEAAAKGGNVKVDIVNNRPVLTVTASTIKRGQSGDEVKAVQEMLKEAGYEIEADGQFGAKTEAAVKEFQKDHGLQVDGMIGNQTISMLGAVSSTMEAPDYVKAVAINSAKKAEPGGLHSDTLIISDKEMEKVLKKVEAKAEQAGPNNYVKVEIVNNKPVIKGTAPTSQPATNAAGTAPVGTTSDGNRIWELTDEKELTYNYSINEAKNKWAEATTKEDKDYWANEAEKLRERARAAGRSESEILQAGDAMIPMEEIMKRAHEENPALSFIQGFVESAAIHFENHPGEAAVVAAGSFFFKAEKTVGKETGEAIVEGADEAADAASAVAKGVGKYSDAEIKKILDELKDDGFKNNPLRQAYEKEVADLSKIGDDLLKQGMPKDEVAKTLHQARRDLGVKYKDATPQPLRDYIYELNQSRYNDPLGPKFEDLLENGKTYDQIIESASRPNADINKLLSGFEEWLRGQ